MSDEYQRGRDDELADIIAYLLSPVAPSLDPDPGRRGAINDLGNNLRWAFANLLKNKEWRASSVPEYRWTTSPPTTPGWYWAMRKPRGEFELQVVRFIEPEIVLSMSGDELDSSDFDLWSGPIEPPTMTEGRP